MSDSDQLIVPSGIPQFTGDLGTLETETKALAADAKLFRDSGASVHSTFQGLSACYTAPEADKLFATTKPVQTKSDAFADDLEKVSAALSAYAGEVKPLVKRLENLKSDAIDFVSSVEGDDDWRKDKKKVDRNNELVRGVNAAVSAFQAAERTCHDKIVALVGGKPLVVDDGSHKDNMYGYKANDLDHAEKLPWGSMAQREYTGIRWLGHQIKSFVWDGFIVDGIWGTIKGLGTLVGTEGWDKAGQAWTGLAKLSTGLVISTTPLAAAYWMAPEKKLPRWLRDSRTAVKETGKALVAYDQWGKNPARAAGGVTFNVLTTVFTGGSGAAAKGGAVAKTLSTLGKAGRIVDPITYVGKAGKVAFVKVGDLMSGLKNLRMGSTVHIADEAFTVPAEAAAHLPKRPADLPESAVPFLDNENKVVYLDKKTGAMYDEHGGPRQPASEVKKELSADERAAAARQPEAQPQHDSALVSAGVRNGDVSASAGRGAEHGANHGMGGGAHDLGRGPSAAHDVPGTSGGHSGPVRPTHDTPGSGTAGHNSGGHGGHGDSSSPPHEHGTPRHADDVPPPRDGSHGNGRDSTSANAHGNDGAHHDGHPPVGHSPEGPGEHAGVGETGSGETHHGPGHTPGEQPGTPGSKGALAEKRGREYEVHLQEKLGGGDSFREGGREFDGSYPGGKEDARTWYEAKSGAYWERANQHEKVMLKFKANLGDARRIAAEHGKEFLLISEKEIPENIVKWLEKKGYNWKIIPKE